MIGDPSGKSEERNLLDTDTLAANVEAIKNQLSRFLDFDGGDNAAVMVNNHDWFKDVGYLEFLRDVGKLMTVNYMIGKESVKARLEQRDHGISYTEFSYMLLQAYDFAVLARDHGVRLQAGGSDQWGNITAGVELYRKMVGGPSIHGFTAPLLLDNKGEKMGKTAGGTKIWLDTERTSPYAFYQYWLNVEDADVGRLLRIFSFRSLEELAEIEKAHNEAPHRRTGQKTLAEDITTFVHGPDALRRAVAASQVMFGGSLEDLSDADLEPLLADVPHSELPSSRLDEGVPLVELLAETGLAPSKGAARRLIKGGGVYINNVKCPEVDKTVTKDDRGTESMIILRSGKKSYHIVQIG
jgi:tyrosyl-tRNA synthetase